MAERVGFEPTVGCPITSFQDWLLKPLGHLSIGVNDTILRLKSQVRIMLQALISCSSDQPALAGEVEGRQIASRLMTDLRYFL